MSFNTFKSQGLNIRDEKIKLRIPYRKLSLKGWGLFHLLLNDFSITEMLILSLGIHDYPFPPHPNVCIFKKKMAHLTSKSYKELNSKFDKNILMVFRCASSEKDGHSLEVRFPILSYFF